MKTKYIIGVVACILFLMSAVGCNQGNRAYVDHGGSIRIVYNQKQFNVPHYRSIKDVSSSFFDKIKVTDTLELTNCRSLIAVLVQKDGWVNPQWDVWDQQVYDEYLARAEKTDKQEDIQISVTKPNEDLEDRIIDLKNSVMGHQKRIEELEKQMTVIQGEAK